MAIIESTISTGGEAFAANRDGMLALIGKIREANLATMTLINKEASHHGGKELSIRKMKELGAQAEKEATELFAAETKQRHTM